jgi:amino-acid N-acetyltransferase
VDERTVTLQRADADALKYVERLLEANGLPSADIEESPGRFYVATVNDEAVGVGGLEVYGANGLLRSVVVERSARGDGVGTAICDALEREARAAAVETLYLLTTTAADFFAARGYVEIERSNAPAALQRTAEFDELCPATATCMRTSLVDNS